MVYAEYIVSLTEADNRLFSREVKVVRIQNGKIGQLQKKQVVKMNALHR